MATERDRLLNRIEGDDDQPTGTVVSRNLTRLCIITTVLMFFFMIAAVALAAVLGVTKANESKGQNQSPIFDLTNSTIPLSFFNLTNATILKPLYNVTNGTRLNNTLCLETQCVQVAARITSYMDTSVHPCNDFYQYSCGGWEKKTVLPDGLDTWGTFEELAQSNYQFLIKALSNSTKSDSTAIMKTKQIFAACTDTEQIQADIPEALNRYLTRTGGWNEANITQNGSWSINSSLVVEHYYGSDAFFSFDIEPDDKNSSIAVIKVCNRKVHMTFELV